MKRRGPALTPRGWSAVILLTGFLALVTISARAPTAPVTLSIWSVTQ